MANLLRSPVESTVFNTLGIVVILLSLASCHNSKELQLDSNQYFATSTSTPAFETLQPSTDSSIATPSVTPTVISATPTVSSTILPLPTTTIPPNMEEDLQEITKQVIRVLPDLEILESSYLESSQASGKQFEAGAPTPTKIIASTHDCQLISIDTLTLEQAVIWHYSGADYRHFYCKGFDNKNEILPDIEGPIGYIENLEWIDSRYLLISLCCEPAIGKFEVIDILQSSNPLFLALEGRYPSVNKKNILLYNIHTSYPIGSVIFDVNYDISDPNYPFFSLESEPIFYTLSFDPELDTDAFILEVTWVGDDKIVFELWVNHLHDGLYPFIGIFNTVSHSSTFKSRGDGWTLPTGDANGNLVVMEQPCNYVNNYTNNVNGTCDTQGGKIVLLNPDTLLPYYEIVVQENIVDMDLSSGSLLVTFLNGEMGIFNLSDGSYRSIDDGITNAIWAE